MAPRWALGVLGVLGGLSVGFSATSAEQGQMSGPEVGLHGRPECEHTIDLYDCYGDGWNDNTLDVYVNGNLVLAGITLTSGSGPATFTFMAASGDTIVTVYNAIGGWPYEPYYYIYDGYGTLIGLDGVFGTDCYVQPTGITAIGNCNPPTDGACCYYDGGCEMVPSADDCIDGLFLGLGHQCWECPCYVPCPPGAIPEPEPCGEDTNGGCGSDPPAFAPIACGETVCGTLWADTSLRDTDWYQLTLDTPQYLTWTAESQIPLLIFIIQGAGPGNCSSYSVLASASAGECVPASLTVEGSAGTTYWFWAGPSVWSDLPCPQGYTATLSCAPVPTGACCLPSGDCIVINASGCTAQSGIYQGDDVSCDDVVCEQFYCDAGAIYCDEYISRVQIDVIDNPSGCGVGQYEDYTDLGPATVTYGVGTALTVTNGNPIWSSDICSVWIDWNQDCVFDDVTEVIGDVNGVGPYVFNITPPPSALPGPTCMRIRIDYANSNPQPCGNSTYGEVEDYTVVIRELEGVCCWPEGACTIEPASACGGYWAGANTACANEDCNSNGIDDFCEIETGLCRDADRNGILDDCDADCNSNGIPDVCELAGGCEVGECGLCYMGVCGLGDDCQANGVLDACDIADGTSADCQSDGIPDECQLGPGGGGVSLQIDDGSSENNWGLTAGGELCWINHFDAGGPASVAGISVCFGTPAHPNSSGVSPGAAVRVYLWSDPNQDGNPADAVFLGEGTGVVEAGSIDTDIVQVVAFAAPIAVNGSFFAGASVVTTSGYPAPADDNGWTGPPDQAFLTFNSVPLNPTTITANLYPMSALGFPQTVFLVRTGGGGGDCNENGVPDACDVPPICEGPDCSLDCQPDLIPDECQLEGNDCNENGRPDDCDIASGWSLDCQPDGIPDECQLEGNDCNGNLVPDDCDLASGTSQDCNDNGIPDECDIASGASCDCQGDGIPDECQLWVKDRDLLVWDDGSTENSLGLTAGGELCWMHHFNATQGGVIQKIWTCFGTPLYPGSSGVTPGAAFRVYVWSDPNGDGNPNDAVFLGEASGVVSGGSIDTDVLQSVAIDIPIPANLSFFVGASVVTTGGNPAPMDENGFQYGKSWLAFNQVPFNPTNFVNLYKMTDIGYPCNWLLRTEVSYGAPPNDCDENGIPDECDIGAEWGGYCEGQGGCWPDECGSDWNHNGIPESCDDCGDLNYDAAVNLDDYWIFLSAYGTCLGAPNYNPAADLDGDGCVTLADYHAWRMCYLMANGKEFVAPKPQPMPSPARETPGPAVSP